YYINHFLAFGLANRLEDKRVRLKPEEVKISGQTGRRFVVESELGTKKNIDIYEIYWRDLVDDLNDKSIRYRVFRGIYLLFYWLFASLKIGRISRIFFFQVLGILLLITAWEYSTVTLALTAIGNDPNTLGFRLPSELATTLGKLGTTLGGWQTWLITSAILSVLPVPTNVIVNLLDFMVRYAEDDTERGSVSLRDRLRYRLSSVLDDALNETKYDKITVLAHSLGTVLAVDFLADYKHPSAKKISFITLGSPLKTLASVSSWISEEIRKCVNNKSVEEWSDFYSNQDWLCTEAPVSYDEENNKFQAEAISLRVSLAKQMSGEVHLAYFSDRLVLEKIIE
ncbi:MAG: hypothetical protein ACK46E_22035, partial [Pseudanabaena sp.]